MAQEMVKADAAELALMSGDLSRLTSEQRLSYYHRVCTSMGLNPLTRPFDYITLNGKLTLYCKRDATDQLRKINGVSIKLSEPRIIEGVCIVRAEARTGEGRSDEATGAVSIMGLKGDALANAYMKAETKAKRRVTLSICGLGWLDESEADSIPTAQRPAPEPIPVRPRRKLDAAPPPAPAIEAEESVSLADAPAPEDVAPPPSSGSSASKSVVDIDDSEYWPAPAVALPLLPSQGYDESPDTYHRRMITAAVAAIGDATQSQQIDAWLTTNATVLGAFKKWSSVQARKLADLIKERKQTIAGGMG